MELDVIPNSETRKLFSRLHARVVERLSSEIGEETNFLALRIETNEGDVYVSYNGGSIEEENAIELHPSLASPQKVRVEAVEVWTASTVEVEPSTLAEWEILECHAQFLEEGGLLNQVSVLYLGQIARLHVPGGGVVRLKVVRLEGVEEDFARIARDTRMLVRPKRRPPSDYDPRVLRVEPVQSDFSEERKMLFGQMENFGAVEGLRTFSSLPYCPPFATVWMHPETLGAVSGWDYEVSMGEESVMVVVRKNFEEEEDKERKHDLVVAKLCPDDSVTQEYIAMNTHLRYQTGVTPLQDCLWIKVLTKSQVFRSLLKRDVTVSTCPVSLMISLENSPRWSIPSNLDTVLELSSAYQQDLDHDACWDCLMHDFPITTGTLISFPLRHRSKSANVQLHDKTEDALFQLTVIENSNDLPSNIPGNVPKFIMSSNLHLLKSSYFHSRKPVTINLPPSSLFFTLHPKTPLTRSLQPALYTSLKDLLSSNVEKLILHGDSGSGKTHLALLLISCLQACNVAVVYLDCKMLQSSLTRMDLILDCLAETFRSASLKDPCLVVLDDLDAIVPCLENAENEEDSSLMQSGVSPVLRDQVKLLSDTLVNLMDANPCLRYVVTCKDKYSVHEGLRRVNRFGVDVEIPNLHAMDKLQILESLVGDAKLDVAISQQLQGYCPKDLSLVAERYHHMIYLSNLGRCPSSTFNLTDILDNYTPLSLQTTNLSHGTTNWEDVGGLFDAKKLLHDIVIQPLTYRKIYDRSPVKLPRGILLFGPPGCGKSLLPQALAKHTNLNLLTISGPSLLSRYIGQSELKLREYFKQARNASPSMLFLDDIDALAPKRGSDNTGVTDRIVNQLLTFLDGIEDRGEVYVVGATSRPDVVDRALLRPGRLEKWIHVGLPCGEERAEIMTIYAREFPLDCDPDYVRELGRRAQYFSPADLRELFDRAYLNAVSLGHQSIAKSHLEDELLTIRPSVTKDEKTRLYKLYKHFFSHKKRADGQDPGIGSPASPINSTWDKINFDELQKLKVTHK